MADIGGTNSRFARMTEGGIADKDTQATGGKGSIVAALTAYVAGQGSAPERIVIAAAGPKLDGRQYITNGEDSFTAAEVTAASGAGHVELINDFVAASWSLVDVSAADVRALQGDARPAAGNRGILGPGTGLGVGALIRTGRGYHAFPSEGGHVGVAGQSAFERDVFAALIANWPEVAIGSEGLIEAEAIVSGTGLPLVYRAVAEVMGVSVTQIDSAAIFAQAKAEEPVARASVEIFARHLAQVAGDLAVTLVAHGGIFFAGGVAQANDWIFDADFLEAFNAGGRFTELKRSFGLYLYENRDFGLIGAANALRLG